MHKGKFVVFEGLDGSGKSTHMKLLAENLIKQGEKVWQTVEPTDGLVGHHIRAMLTSGKAYEMHMQAALFLADRLEHITDKASGIKRYLDDGYTVICDRYYYSSFAYQGTATDMDWVMDINLKAPVMLKPDMCVFMDVPPEECKNRLDAQRESLDLYEKDLELMKNIRSNFIKVFEKLKETENIAIIDAVQDVESVAADILAHFAKL